MRAEFDGEETAAEARSQYLKEMMNIRKVTAEQLSDMTGISKRTLENYVSGRTDPAMGQGLRIALICYVLSMNAYTLGGANDIKPGTPFQSNGRRIVRNTRSFPGPDYGLSRRLFGYAMEHSGMDVETLSKKSGVPPRVIKEILDHRRDLRVMRAQTVFKMCKAMIFHPAFLYGLRSMREYEAYRNQYNKAQEDNAFRSEVRDEVEKMVRQRRAETDSEAE